MNQYTGIYRRCELWFIRRELEQFGLQPLEGKIIMFLQDNQCTQEDIGAHFDLDKGRIARSLSELEEKGLVRRLINEVYLNALVEAVDKRRSVQVLLSGGIRFWKKYTAYQAGGTRFVLRDSQRKSAGSSRIICGGLLKMQLNINTE